MLKPEKRPFPIIAYNQLSRLFGIRQHLSFDGLIGKARKNTGLNHLGKDFNEEALRVLIDSINEEAQLHPFGMMMIREKLISQLENRLWATYWFRKQPEILEQQLLPIILITGLQRTGTTKMQRLLSSLEGARELLSWEALYPAPIGQKEETKRRIARTRRNEKAVKWISPTFHAIHPIHADQPEEDVLLLDVHFMSSSSEAIMHVPTYAAWLEKQDHTEAYLYEAKLLKLLQWQRHGAFWVLKSPHHLQYLRIFKQVFPDSKIVWMHRSPDKTIPSFLSMLYHSRNMFTNRVDEETLKSHWLQKLNRMLKEGDDFRNDYPTKIIDVDFDNFLDDEEGTLHQLTQKLDVPMTRKIGWEDNKKMSYNSNHNYQLSDWGLTGSDLEQKNPKSILARKPIDIPKKA